MAQLPGKLGPYKPLQKIIDCINQLIDYCASLRPSSSLNTFTSHTSNGVRRQSAAEDATAPAAGMVFRGEWSPTGVYTSQNVVVVRGGVAAGAYVAVIDVPAGTSPAFPDVGIYWASLGRDFPGAWA